MTARGPSRFAPAVAAAMLVSLFTWNFVERSTAGNVEQYLAQARKAIDRVPWNIGSFIGTKLEVQRVVVELLKPNNLLQRHYVVPETGEWFDLLVVQCSYAKDLDGHYPPNCYPRAGWVKEQDPSDFELHAGGIPVPVRRYRFRYEGGILPQRIDILSFFIVPAGQPRFGRDMELVNMLSRSPKTDKLGAAQVQILTPAEMSEEARRKIWQQTLDELEPVLTTIAEGAE
ncbi:MAG: exosortase-associated EpsI family protein [Phycisphaerales bacterium]|nr:exosortase-associated EpsI family protein [Phycisphaerales bacterium]